MAGLDVSDPLMYPASTNDDNLTVHLVFGTHAATLSRVTSFSIQRTPKSYL
jgi:hypothetical protein